MSGQLWKGILLSVLATCVVSLDAAAQACVGTPAARGQKQVGLGLATTDVFTSFDLNGGVRLNGPVTLGGLIGMIDYDGLSGNGLHIGVNGSYEIPSLQSVSGCVTGAVGIVSLSQDIGFGFGEINFTTTTIPIGFAIGKKLDMSGGMFWIPNAGLALVITSVSADYGVGYPGAELDASSTDLGLNFGATIGKERWFVRGSIGLSSADESDAVFGLFAGLVLR